MHNNRTLCAVLLRAKLKRVGLLLHNVMWALVDGRRVEPGTRIAYEHAYSTHAEVDRSMFRQVDHSAASSQEIKSGACVGASAHPNS